MRKVILDLAVTLDGFIEGPNGEIDWCIVDGEMNFDEFLSDIDTIFYGRISYDLWGKYQPEEGASEAEKNLWKGVHSKEKYVFSRNAQQDDKVTFINSDIAEMVKEIKSREGKNIWLYGGGSLITTFINLGLVDIFRLAVHPVILGAGKPLFSDIDQRVNLILDNIRASKSGVTLLHYHRE